MNRIASFFLFSLIAATPALSGALELSLSPPAVPEGGVASLRWAGQECGSSVITFNGHSFTGSKRGEDCFVLLGVDLDTAEGRYPVRVEQGGASGETFLGVLASSRPEERLTLPGAMVTPRAPEVIDRILREQKALSALFARREGPALWEEFRRPVADPVGSVFGLRRILNGEPRSAHAGVDFRSPRGTAVLAPGRGRVVLAENLYFTGKTVVLDHGAGLFSLYAHLDELSCRPGELLESRQKLGTVGSTGRSTGPHLHWGVKLRGDRIDPLAMTELFGKGLDSSTRDGNN